MTTAYSAYGTLIQRGDGGVGAGTKASKTVGTTNQQIVIRAKNAGTYGNSLTAAIVVSGNSTAFSIVVTSTSVIINSATDGSAAATTTVLQAIAALYANSTFDANFDATVGVGNGSGVLVASASSVLSGGAAGTEIFTSLDGAKNITGPQFSTEEIDITNHTSGSSYRERLPSFKSGGEVSIDLLYNPSDTQHEGLFTDFENRTLRNFKMVLPDVGNCEYDFAAYVMGLEVQAPIDNALMLGVKLVITGPVTRTL